MRRPPLATPLVFLSVSLSAQTIDPQAILNEVRRQAVSTVQRAPRYTCTESVERYWYAARKPARPGCEASQAPEINDENLVRSDRLRLDVAVGAGEEIFSWHGQKSFQTDEIDQLVTSGPVNSGTYFSFLSSIFMEGVAKIDFRGTRDQGEKRLAVFGYVVPIGDSHFETRTASGKQVMGYHGEFTVDMSNHQLQELVITTDDMPEAAAACGFSIKTRYAATLLNGVPFQLPASVLLDVLSLDHEKRRTVTGYENCHEFTAQSSLRFDDAPPAAHSSAPKPERTLPPGLPVRIRIKGGIDPEKAWAGDPIEGELAADIVDSRLKLLVPKGAPARGLLLDAAIMRRPSRSYVVALQFQELRFAGEEYKLNLDSVPEPDPEDVRTNERRGRIQLSNPPISNRVDGRFLLNGKQVKMNGLTTNWVTK